MCKTTESLNCEQKKSSKCRSVIAFRATKENQQHCKENQQHCKENQQHCKTKLRSYKKNTVVKNSV